MTIAELVSRLQQVQSMSIVGMCKNAGKTTVLNKLIAELNESRVRLGLTSIGRDGESTDLVTRTAKPGIYVYEGTLVATAVDMFRLSDLYYVPAAYQYVLHVRRLVIRPNVFQ